jgi:hypothetical protein
MHKRLRNFSIILFLPICVFGCESIQKTSGKRRMYKQIYLNQFKLTYVRHVLLKTYHYSPEIKAVLSEDHSGFTEPVLTDADYQFIDSLSSADYQQLVIDSANSIGRVAEGAEGKHTLQMLLTKIESKSIERLARTRYQYAKKDLHYFGH